MRDGMPEPITAASPFFSKGKERLKPGGAMYVMLSSHGDLGLFGKLIERAGLQAQIAAEHSIYFESYLLYKLTPVP
jgi:hypothetical protein